MYYLKALEWAFGAFLLVFVVWQIAAPLLMGKLPFPAFRSQPVDDAEGEEKHGVRPNVRKPK
jgi:hypothetical protein